MYELRFNLPFTLLQVQKYGISDFLNKPIWVFIDFHDEKSLHDSRIKITK